MQQRDRYQSLLQVIGLIAIVTFHVGPPGAGAGWSAVALFFALAGFNMARRLDDQGPVMSFARLRVRRMAPELGLIWCVVAVM